MALRAVIPNFENSFSKSIAAKLKENNDIRKLFTSNLAHYWIFLCKFAH